MSRIGEKFAELNSKKERALIGYAVAGYPDQEQTFDVVSAMVRGGVDILELGIPFSDPIADGHTIQRASYEALQKGMTPRKALELAKRINGTLGVPLAVMTYYNILYRPGFDSFLGQARSSSVDGVIIPDLTYEESEQLKQYAVKYNMDTIFLVSPNTSARRIRTIVKLTTGFLYLVSVFGTTGERDTFERYTADAIRRVKKCGGPGIPLGVGFGVSRPEHVRFMLDAGADAVIVGSAFVNLIEESSSRQDALAKVESLARSLKEVTRVRTPA